jgi:hypothetical protein
VKAAQEQAAGGREHHDQQAERSTEVIALLAVLPTK